MKYLAELDLHGNVLTKLPDVVGEMQHLTSINLANNSLSIFPDKLTEIATLETINLEGNSITGNKDLLKHVVCVGGIFVYFKLYLTLCYMYSSAEIPVEKLSNMPALKWLNLKSNPLDSNTQSALQSPHKFDILSTTES